MNPLLSSANATTAGHFDSRHSNVTRDVHDTLPVGPSFGIHASPDSRFTAYRTNWDSLYVSLFSFVLEHRFAPSVHVHNPPPPWPGSGQVRNTTHFPFLSRSRAHLRSPVTSVTNSPAVSLKPRVPITVCVVTSCLDIVQAARAEPSRVTHTRTHFLSFFSPLSPSRLRFPFLGSEGQPRTHKVGLTILATVLPRN